MATCDHPSELVYRIAYPSLQRPGLRIDSRIAALPAEEEKQLPVRSNLQGKEVGDIFLHHRIATAKSLGGSWIAWPSCRSSCWR